MILLDQKRLHRILKRMAYQIVEKAGGRDVDMLGLNKRGMAVGQKIAGYISGEGESKVNFNQMWVDDDRGLDSFKQKNKDLIIVDDVVYSGKTIFRALNSIPELYDYEFVTIASVIDRGHRKIPVKADIVGLKVPTKVNEHVEFVVREGVPFNVILTKK